jgi:hypothetical protein
MVFRNSNLAQLFAAKDGTIFIPLKLVLPTRLVTSPPLNTTVKIKG